MVELHPYSRKLMTMALEGSNGPDFQCVPSLLRMFSKGKSTASSLMCQVSQELPMTWSFMEEMISNTMEISLTLWKFVGTKNWPWMLKRCSSDFQKLPSLNTHGVAKDYHWIQRKFSCEKNGNASRYGNNERFPRLDQLSQPIQSTFSWIKWPFLRDMQAENGIQAYKNLQGWISILQGENFQEYHTFILQS